MNFNGELYLNNTQIFVGPIVIDGDFQVNGVLKLADGVITAPSLAFTSEPGLGI